MPGLEMDVDERRGYSVRLEPLPEHVCDRRCVTEHVLGNLYRCCTSGTTHVCDMNCRQRIPYSACEDICRVSRRVFPAANAGAGPRGAHGQGLKRTAPWAGEEGAEPAMQRARPLAGLQAEVTPSVPQAGPAGAAGGLGNWLHGHGFPWAPGPYAGQCAQPGLRMSK